MSPPLGSTAAVAAGCVGDGLPFTVQPFHAADWPEARRMLLDGYPGTPTALWDRGFQRLQAVPPMAGDSPLGVLLQQARRTVGVALLIPSRRPAALTSAPRVNASSWAIEPHARGRALWMARQAMDDPATVYTALTPIVSAARMLQRIGFRPVSHQCIVGFTPRLARLSPGRARVLVGAEALHALRQHPLASVLHDHQRLACLVMALDTGDALVPLVWRPQRRLRVLRTAELLYAPSQAVVAAHASALAGPLLRHGYALLAFEAHQDLVPDFPCTRLFQRRLARGPYDERAVDHLYSEIVYLHR